MRRSFLLSAAVLAVCPAWAQLTLPEAERIAIANQPQLTAAQLNAAAAGQVPLELRSVFFPNVTGLATGVGADSGSRLAAGGLNNPVVYNRLGTGLSLNQLISDFGRTSNLVESAKLRAQGQEQLTQAARAQILLRVDRAYFEVLRAEALLMVAQQTVSARQLLADQVSSLARSNLKSTLDVSFANVNLADAKLLQASADNEVQASRAELAASMGVPREQANAPLVTNATAEPLPNAVEPLIDQALRDRPELADLRLEQTAAERYAQAEKDLSLPTVAVAAAAGFAPAAEAAIPGRYGAVGVNVSIPILNGHLFRARRAEAELRSKAAAQNVNDLVLRVTRDVRVAYLDASTAFQRLGLTAELVSQARLALQLAQSRYDLGLSSIIELSQAQLNATSAEIANSNAQYDYQIQRSNLSYQTGALR